MEDHPDDTQTNTESRHGFEQQLAEVHRSLVEGGFITPHRKQKVDLALVEEFLKLRGSAAEDGLPLLTRLQNDLNADGCAEVTLEFVLRMDKRMMKVAVEEYSAELTADDSDPMGQGMGFILDGKYREAVGAFSRAIELGVGGNLAYWKRGNAFRLLGDYRRALFDLDRYIASGDPWRRPTAFTWRAESLMALGQVSEAIRTLADAVADLEVNRDPGCRISAAVCPSPEQPEQEHDDEELPLWAQEENRKSALANEFRNVAKALKMIQESDRTPADLRPMLEEVIRSAGELGTRLGL